MDGKADRIEARSAQTTRPSDEDEQAQRGHRESAFDEHTVRERKQHYGKKACVLCVPRTGNRRARFFPFIRDGKQSRASRGANSLPIRPTNRRPLQRAAQRCTDAVCQPSWGSSSTSGRSRVRRFHWPPRAAQHSAAAPIRSVLSSGYAEASGVGRKVDRKCPPDRRVFYGHKPMDKL